MNFPSNGSKNIRQWALKPSIHIPLCGYELERDSPIPAHWFNVPGFMA